MPIQYGEPFDTNASIYGSFTNAILATKWQRLRLRFKRQFVEFHDGKAYIFKRLGDCLFLVAEHDLGGADGIVLNKDGSMSCLPKRTR